MNAGEADIMNNSLCHLGEMQWVVRSVRPSAILYI